MKIKNIFLIFFILLASLTWAAPVKIKIATVAPNGSPWHKALVRMKGEWIKRSKGQVQVIIYANGTQGTETEMVDMMRMGQLHAGALTPSGMGAISQYPMVFSVPLLIQNNDEAKYLLKSMAPIFDKKIEEQGFKMISWNMIGWMYFFSRFPVTTPEDLTKHKISVGGEPALSDAFREVGCQVVNLGSTDIVLALKTGMIDTIYSIPLFISYGFYEYVEYMSPVKICPLLGGLVFSRRGWNMVPPQFRDTLMEGAVKAFSTLEGELQALDQKALDMIRDKGVKMPQGAEGNHQKWIDFMKDGYPILIGSVVPTTAFYQAKNYLEFYRKGQK